MEYPGEPHAITSVLLRRELIGSAGGTNATPESIRRRGLLASREGSIMVEVAFALPWPLASEVRTRLFSKEGRQRLATRESK